MNEREQFDIPDRERDEQEFFERKQVNDAFLKTKAETLMTALEVKISLENSPIILADILDQGIQSLERTYALAGLHDGKLEQAKEKLSLLVFGKIKSLAVSLSDEEKDALDTLQVEDLKAQATEIFTTAIYRMQEAKSEKDRQKKMDGAKTVLKNLYSVTGRGQLDLAKWEALLEMRFRNS